MRVNPGATNVIVPLYIVDDVGGTAPGEPQTGLLFSDIETGGSASYQRQGAARVDLTLITQTVTGAHSDGGFIEIDATNMPGTYRCDFPDAAFAAGVDFVILQVVPASANNAIARPVFIDLTVADVSVTEWLGTAAATPTTAGVPSVALTAIGLDAILAAATGAVEIAKAIWDRALTGGTHNIATSAGRRLRSLQDFGVYEGGYVWVDTVNGTAGTTDFENGTVNLPVDTIADASTIRTSIGLPGFHMIPGSTITLAATFNNIEFDGHGWTLALGGQDVDHSHFFNAVVSGVGTAANEMEFHDCEIGTVSLQKARSIDCSFDGTVTMTLAGDYSYINCQSGIAGPGAPVFTKTAGQTITAQWRRWSNGITVSGIESGDTMTISGTLGTVTLNGADGTVEIRGTYKAIVDNRTGSPTLNTDGAIKGVDVASILEDTNELQTDWANGGRLDLLLDAIPTTAMRGTDGANTTTPLSAAQVNAECDTAISDAALATAANLAIVDTVVDGIKVTTDKFVFTVVNQVDANTQSVNDVAVTGTGALGDEWGP